MTSGGAGAPAQAESMQWETHRLPAKTAAASLQLAAERVVAWVIANGGEAEYQSHRTHDGFIYRERAEGGHTSDLVRPARIAVRTRDGWAYCAAGQRVVRGETSFIVKRTALSDYSVREFTVED